MKITRIAITLLLGILLVSGLACCPAPGTTPTGQVMKPTVSFIPSNWELQEDTPYPQYAGRIEEVNWEG